jgi:hypothetical protein
VGTAAITIAITILERDVSLRSSAMLATQLGMVEAGPNWC